MDVSKHLSRVEVNVMIMLRNVYMYIYIDTVLPTNKYILNKRYKDFIISRRILSNQNKFC